MAGERSTESSSGLPGRKSRPLLEVMCWDGYINGSLNRESSDENRYVPVQPMILLSNGKTEREFGENTLF